MSARCAAAALAVSLTVALFTGKVPAQLPAGTTDTSSSSTAPTPSPEETTRAEASDALNHGDFPRALRVLQPLAERNPGDPHILFDLASAQDALSDNDPAQVTNAESNYRRSIAADPNGLEPHLALGLLLARHGREGESRSELRTATTLQTSDPALTARAWRALAHLDAETDPAASRDDLLAALKLSPPTADDDLLSASLAASSQQPAEAEAAYRRVLAARPNDPEATAGLARLLLDADRFDEAATPLNAALAAHPGDVTLTTALASVQLRQGQPARAAALVGDLHKAHPDDRAITTLEAHLLSDAGQYEAVDELLLHAAADGPLLDLRADALVHLRRLPEAEQLLAAAIGQPGTFPSNTALANAAGRLAFVASTNNHPEETLRALDLRARFLPQSPSTLFLGATAHDRLHHPKQARNLYRQFLAAANGQFPDETTEARHRLLVLDRVH